MYSRITVAIGVMLVLMATAVGGGEGSRAERKAIYQVDGKGMERVEAALVRARRDNKRVLLKIGGNWCGWCYKLHDVLHKEKAVAQLLRAEYELVMIDSKADKAVIETWGIKPKGYPYLAVLDASGKKVTEQRTDPLEVGSKHDPKKVAAFLEKWRAAPLAADDVFAKALAQARKERKTVFVRVGAPWCGWCVRMDKFLARPEIAKILEKDYVVAKIDLTRMTGAEAVVAEIRKPGEGGGIPWFAFLDGEGKILVTSTKPGGGNIGFPVDPEKEIPHFVAMLRQTRAKVSDTDIEYLRAALIKADPRPRNRG
jgi:thioredoxin-related protein